MITLDALVVFLLIEAAVILLGAAVFFGLRYRRLNRRVRRYLEHRKQFILVLEETRDALKNMRASAIREWVQEHGSNEQQAQAIEDARLAYVEQCIEDCRETEGELYRFWRAGFSSLNGILAHLSDQIEAANTLASENTLADDSADAVDYQEQPVDAGETASAKAERKQAERVAELERVVRYQAGKIAELGDFRWRFEEVNTRFVNVRASNERLKHKLYDLLWEKEQTASELDDEALREAMAEFEHSNKEMALCVETLEEENQRLRSQSESIEQEQRDYLSAVESKADNSQDEMAGEIITLEDALAEAREQNDELRKELKALQGEYVALYAQQQAGKAKSERQTG